MAASSRQATRPRAPTPKRQREAREKGQIAQDAGPHRVGSAMLADDRAAADRRLPTARERCTKLLNDMAPRHRAPRPRRGHAVRGERRRERRSASSAPMLLGMMAIGLLANVAQVGFQPTTKKLKPDFGRLNPFKGIKKMVGPQAWWELGKVDRQDRVAASRSRGRSWRTRCTRSRAGSAGSSATVMARVTRRRPRSTMFRNVAIAGLGRRGGRLRVSERRRHEGSCG